MSGRQDSVCGRVKGRLMIQGQQQISNFYHWLMMVTRVDCLVKSFIYNYVLFIIVIIIDSIFEYSSKIWT